MDALQLSDWRVRAALATLVALLLGTLLLASRRAGGGRKASPPSALSGEDDATAAALAAAASGKPVTKSGVVIIGATGAGKTRLAFKMARGVCVTTLPSLAPAHLKLPNGAKLTDCPGAPQARAAALAQAATASAVIFVVDSCANSYKPASDFLYDLLTSKAFVTNASALCIACSKADAPGARSPAAIRAELETELERLKHARPSVATVGDDGTHALLLGSQDAAFTFDADAGVPVTWCACAVTPDDAKCSIADVMEYVADVKP